MTGKRQARRAARLDRVACEHEVALRIVLRIVDQDQVSQPLLRVEPVEVRQQRC